MLDLATAKFAAGSIEARRSAPFRRLMEVVADDARERHRFTDASHGSDFMFGFMLGYTGQTSQLPDHKAEFGAINEMIYPATSKYVPAPVVLSIALGEMGAFEQSVHHTGYEIYSRSPSFLVSAGGVQTPSATPGKLGFINVGERCVDRGAALPTVLIPSSVGYAPTNPAVVRDDLLRIDGFYYNYETEGTFCSGGSRETAPPAPPAKLMWSHDHNLCVYKGFACGTNIVIPPALETCFTPATGRWRFLDSSKCPALPGTKPFYVTVYRRPCPSEAENCLHNWGFFEAVEAMDSACIATSNNPATCFRRWQHPNPAPDAAAAFAEYQTRVLGPNFPLDMANPPSGDAPALAGRYYSPNGYSIGFDAAATSNDKSRAGVDAVNNIRRPALDDWALASGDILNASVCPSDKDMFDKIEISGKGTGLTIDFCNQDKPVWKVH